MWRMVKRLVADDTGQDLVEYALLSAAIGFAGIAAWPLIVTALGNTYRAWDTGTQGIWEVPNPGEGR